MVLVFQFLVLPYAAQVGVFPIKAVAGLGSHTVVSCVSLSFVISSVEWRLNGTSLNELELDVTQDHSVLQLRNVTAELNNSNIQCIADTVPSSNATLLVQGLLSAVGSLLVHAHVDHIYVNWTAPFTLDISTTLVDITYCVDVVSSTSSATLHSECGINVPEFTYFLPPRSWCHEYNFTVSPVNVVGNGTANSHHYMQNLMSPELVEVDTSSTTYSLIMSAPVCDAELRLEDIDDGDVTTVGITDLDIARNIITFDSQLLTSNRRYRVSVSASNIHHNTTSQVIIRTFDITSSSLLQELSGIFASVIFTEHSKATGALLNFIFINDDGVTIDFRKSFGKMVQKGRITQGLLLPWNKFYPGQYMVYVYDIESDKRIMDGVQYQASSSNLTVGHNQEVNISRFCSPLEVTSYGRVISVVFPFSSFQVIAQKNTQNSVSILYVNTSMDPQTPVTLQVTENGEYLVTVLPIQNENGVFSGVAFKQTHTVGDEMCIANEELYTVTDVEIHSTIKARDLTSSVPPIPASTPSQAEFIIIGLGVGLVCFALLSAVLATALVIQCCKQSYRSKVKVQLNQPLAEVGVALSPDGETAETQMYEEIKEPASAPPTQRPANPAPRVPPPALVPQYEDVEISAASNTKHSYQITTCAAYGVAL